MPAPHHHDSPQGEMPDSVTAGGSAIVATTLDRARITMLHPSRIVVVGAGRRLWIDLCGVTRHEFAQVRLVLLPPPEAAADAELQRTLARWAGGATTLHVHELIHPGDRDIRRVRFTDPESVHADVLAPA